MSTDRIEIAAPAKVNLFLEILGRRDDGFHEIETVMQTVDLCDTVILTSCGDGISLECDSATVPDGPDNLAWKAAAVMSELAPGRGVAIKLIKRIPVEGGLGGGSSDAAAVLRGLNTLWDVELGADRLEELAAGLGSDVAFFVRGGTALCTGRGEKIAPIPSVNVLHFVVAVPDFGASTAKIYHNVKLPLTANVKSVKFLIEGVSAEVSVRDISGLVFNRLEQSAFELYPDLVSLRDLLLASGLSGALLSGSGSCVFGIAEDEGSAAEIAELIARQPGIAEAHAVASIAAPAAED